MSRVGLVTHPDYQKHDTGFSHPERPARLEAIAKHLQATGLWESLALIEPYAAPVEWITEIHTPQYVQHIAEACRQGVRFLDADTVVCPLSYHIALLAVGGVMAAIDRVMGGEVDCAFAAVRPPGHHAERDRAMGFCLFNNVAIAARYLQNRYGLERILIIDWDVHHGNGTQHAFAGDPAVFYCSIHQYPHYPGTGSREEQGRGPGRGFTLNVPLPAGSGDTEYMAAFEETILPQARRFCPDFVLISAGFDAHQADPLSAMRVSEEGFARMTEMVKSLARECCEGRLVSVLEGGYHLNALAHSVARHLRTLQQPS
ncbi:MAG: histone deacetylase [Nitrospinota bacterium]|nr:MAG: histone deacetylase [Nitrospinota bacterium]